MAPRPPRQEEDPLDVGEIPLPPTQGPSAIGVPPGYRTSEMMAPAPRRPGEVTGEAGGYRVWRSPLYFDGDELTPSQMSPDQIADLQRQMVAAGLIRPGQRVGVGVWDDTSIDGFYRLLAYANQSGITWQSALKKIQSGSQGAFEVDENGNLVPAGGGASTQIPTRTTPSEELTQVFRRAVIDTLGQGWSEEQIASMVSSYQGMEIDRQRQAIAAEGTTQNIEGVPSPEAFAISQAQQADPGRAQAETGLDYLNQFMSLVGKWG